MGHNGGGGEFASTCQWHYNWELIKVLALISCKHAKQLAQEQLVDPWAQMIFFVQCSDKIVEDLQQKTKNKFIRNGTMCKDKWNSLNSYNKKIANYHKGTRSHTCFWDLSFDEKEKFHLSCQFNRKFYELIETF
jgi:hypothetical protein